MKTTNEKLYAEYKNYFTRSNPDQTPMSFEDFVTAHDLNGEQELDVSDTSHPIHY